MIRIALASLILLGCNGKIIINPRVGGNQPEVLSGEQPTVGPAESKGLELVRGSAANFGTVLLSSSTDITLTLRNPGNADVTSLSPHSLPEPFAYTGGSYPGAGGTCGETLKAGARCSVVLTFKARVLTDAEYVLRLDYLLQGETKTLSVPLQAAVDNSSFPKSAGLDGMVTTILPVANGYWIGGTFTSYNSIPTLKLAHFDLNYNLDTTINLGTSFLEPDVNRAVSVLAAANDSSGDIYVGGRFTEFNGQAVGSIIRLNSDGSLDTNFNTGTGFTYGFSDPGDVYSIWPATDGTGDIYVAGVFDGYDGTAVNNFFVRLNANGTLDTVFNTGTGFIVCNSPPSPPAPYFEACVIPQVQALVTASDTTGDIYIAGNFGDYRGTSRPGIARLNSDGSLDTNYDPGTGFNHHVRDMVAATDGTTDLYVTGKFYEYQGASYRGIVRLNEDLTVDTNFNPGTGITSRDLLRVLATNDGTNDVLVYGSLTIYNGSAVQKIARLNATGSLDGSFGIGTGFGSGFGAWPRQLATTGDASGDLLIASSIGTFDNQATRHLFKIGADGALSDDFAAGTGFNMYVNTGIAAPDHTGAIYVGGRFSVLGDAAAPYVARLTALGEPDPTFTPVGTGLNNEVLALAANSAGKVYVGGKFTSYDSTPLGRLARLLPSGALDTAFSTAVGFNGDLNALLLEESNKIFVAGNFTATLDGTTINRIAKINDDGAFDSTFDAGTGFNSNVMALAAANDGTGSIYAGGSFTTYDGVAAVRIVRLLSNGTVDPDFNSGTGFNGTVYALATADDGSGEVYVGGNFTTYNGTPAPGLVLLRVDGTVDSEFDVGTGFGDGYVKAIATLSDNSRDLIIGGTFTVFQGQSHHRIVRLNRNGTLDSGFTSGSGFNSEVKGVMPTQDSTDEIYVFGNFLSYDSKSVLNIVRLRPNGALD